MATSKNINETGWFYHAPSKPNPNSSMQPAPPPSQIPGLSYGLETAADEQPKRWIKDTDSPYVRLAKQGGRADLLQYKSPKPSADGPQGYPRCDWYYHDDVLTNKDTSPEKGDYQFMLPDYMVHNEWPGHRKQNSNNQNDPQQARRAPFQYDSDSIYSREANPTDKTVKLPEIKPSGYGVRNEKAQGKPVKHAAIARREPIVPQGEYSSNNKYHHRAPKQPEDATLMGRLMSHGYNDYGGIQVLTKHQKVQHQFDEGTRLHEERMQSGQRSKVSTAPSQQDRAAGVATKRAEHTKKETSPGKGNNSTDKELFKLSKFRNVAARTDSHRQQARDRNPIIHDGQDEEPSPYANRTPAQSRNPILHDVDPHDKPYARQPQAVV